jgi:hypothetical protein
MVNGVLECMWVRCECKGEGVSSSTTLNKDREGRRGKGKAPTALRLPLMAGGPCGSKEGKENRKMERKRRESWTRGLWLLTETHRWKGGARWERELTGGFGLSAAQRKRETGGGEMGRCREGTWAGGPTGMKGKVR